MPSPPCPECGGTGRRREWAHSYAEPNGFIGSVPCECGGDPDDAGDWLAWECDGTPQCVCMWCWEEVDDGVS